MGYYVAIMSLMGQFDRKLKACVQRVMKRKNMKNLIFTNLRWNFGSKKVKGKHTHRITGEVKTKTIYMSIQKLVNHQK